MFKYQKGYIFEGHTFVVNKSDIHNAKDDSFVDGTAFLPAPDIVTNADRIRAMTDEELAVFMFSMVDCVSCENKLMNNGKLVFGEKRKTCTDKDYHAMCNGDGRKCEAVCLKWLQQPAEEV